MLAKDALGRQGEQIATNYLVEAGFVIVERNWRCAHGEIDVICRDRLDTVFVEVKTRSSTSFGHPFETITEQKLARIRRLAGVWCEQHSDQRRGSIRIDVVSVLAPPGRLPLVEHLRGVFR